VALPVKAVKAALLVQQVPQLLPALPGLRALPLRRPFSTVVRFDAWTTRPSNRSRPAPSPAPVMKMRPA